MDATLHPDKTTYTHTLTKSSPSWVTCMQSTIGKVFFSLHNKVSNTLGTENSCYNSHPKAFRNITPSTQLTVTRPAQAEQLHNRRKRIKFKLQGFQGCALSSLSDENSVTLLVITDSEHSSEEQSDASSQSCAFKI